MKSFLSFQSRLFAAALFGTALLMLPVQPSAAQADQPPSLIKQLRTNLQSGDSMQQERTLVDVIALAGCAETCTVSLQSIENRKLSIANETGTGAVVELTNLVPDLMNVYRSGPADGHRLLALAALIKIGDENALEQLAEESSDRSSQQSSKVNKTTQKHLAAYYLAKYPELTEKTMRTKALSIEDVRRAEVLRLRKMKDNG